MINTRNKKRQRMYYHSYEAKYFKNLHNFADHFVNKTKL